MIGKGLPISCRLDLCRKLDVKAQYGVTTGKGPLILNLNETIMKIFGLTVAILLLTLFGYYYITGNISEGDRCILYGLIFIVIYRLETIYEKL